MRYNIEHTDSNAVRAIAHSIGGDVVSDVNPVTDTGTGIAVIRFPDDQQKYADDLLHSCESVITYR